MFFHDGFVYGGEPEENLKVIKVKSLPNQIMLLTFNTEETRLFDATVLDGPVYEPLKQQEVFHHPTIDHGVVTWMQGAIDCAPEYMYAHSYEYAEMM